jgi:hypothetical protein
MKRSVTRVLALLLAGMLAALTLPDRAPAQVPPRGDDPDEAVLSSAPIDIGADFIERLTASGPGAAVELKLFDLPVAAVARQVQRHGSGVSWVGRDEKYAIGDVILTVVDGSLLGTVWVDTRQFNIRRAAGGGYVVDEIDTRMFGHLDGDTARSLPLDNPRYPLLEDDPERSVMQFERDAIVGSALARRPAIIAGHHRDPDWVLRLIPEDGSRVDLLVGYTDAAAGRLAERSVDPMAAALHMVNVANNVFWMSGVDTQLNLVHVQRVAYRETNPDPGDTGADLTLDRELNDLSDPINSGSHPDLDVLHTLRDEHRADIVSLLVYVPPTSHSGPKGGIAYTLGQPADPTFNPIRQGGKGQFSGTGFNVVNVNFRSTYDRIFVHEVGHNFGARHDRYTIQQEGDTFGSMPGAFGYVALTPLQTGPWRTLMAYPTLCLDVLGESCTQLPRFSDPTSSYSGWPLGVSASGALTDNRSVLDLTRITVANFRHALFP